MEIFVLLIPVGAALFMNWWDDYCAARSRNDCPPHLWTENNITQNLQCEKCGYRNSFNNLI